jgi:rhodanese-related sulfurtransferase
MAPWWWPFGRVPETTAGELHERLAHGAKIQLLDVRTRREFAHGHIAGAVNVPIQTFRGQLAQMQLDSATPVVTICKTAHRSPAATRVLRAHGFDAVQLANGMDDWRRHELPVQQA